KRYNAEWPNLWFSTLLTPYFIVLLGYEFYQYGQTWKRLCDDFSWTDFTSVIANLFDVLINLLQAFLEFLTPIIEGFDGENITGKTVKYVLYTFLPVFYDIQHFYGEDSKRYHGGWWECSKKLYDPGPEQDNGEPDCGYEKWNKRFQKAELWLLFFAAVFNCEAGISEIAITIFEFFEGL
ncbi:MAG: hypothetical protein ACFFDT_28510, partial [Candidatus Hodarchaeota archaeon]